MGGFATSPPSPSPCTIAHARWRIGAVTCEVVEWKRHAQSSDGASPIFTPQPTPERGCSSAPRETRDEAAPITSEDGRVSARMS